SDLHDYIKFLKWGYGKATDHACREIRLKRLTREEGIDLVSKFQDKTPDPQMLALFLNWLGISAEDLFEYIDRKRDPNIWKKNSGGRWELLDSVLKHRAQPGIEQARLQKDEDCQFKLMPLKAPQVRDDQYVLVGRGWVD